MGFRMIVPADIAALQHLLYRGLDSGQLQVDWHTAESHAEIPLTPSQSLQVWSPLLPPYRPGISGGRRALRHDRLTRVLAGAIVEVELLPREQATGHWRCVALDRTDGDDTAAICTVELGRERLHLRRETYVTLAGQYHERRPLLPATVILIERSNERPGGPVRLLSTFRAWDFAAAAPPAPMAGSLANAVRDALTQLDDAAWRSLTAAVTPFPLGIER
jgi:hypothetical protein